MPFKRLRLLFLKEVLSAHQGCVYILKNTIQYSTIVKYYYNLKQLLSFIAL